MHVGSKMPMRSRLGRIDRSGGTNDKSDEMNLMKNMGLDHRTWRVVSKWLERACNLMKMMKLDHSTWRVGLKIGWRGGNLMKNMELAISDLCVGLKIYWIAGMAGMAGRMDLMMNLMKQI